jgi:large repetitive protein
MRALRLTLVAVLIAVFPPGCGKAPEGVTGDSRAASPDAITFEPPSGTALPNVTVGEVYSQTIAIARGGMAPYGVTVLELPAGLTWTFESPDGIVTGTPVEAGASRIRLRVRDAQGTMAEATYPVTVEPPGALLITPDSLPAATLNVAYSATIVATGAQPPCVWFVRGELPPGLNLVASAGAESVENELRGTPMTPGTYTFTVTVTDSATPPRTGTASFTLPVP